MQFYRVMIKILSTTKISNQNVLKEANKQRQLITNIRERDCRHFWLRYEENETGRCSDN